VSASVTKSAAWRIHLPAFWTEKFHFMPASITKYGVFRILMLALWAFHFYALQIEI
jgi:hypothetical protein